MANKEVDCVKAMPKWLKKYWTLIWLVVAAAVTVGAFVAIADYTGVHSVWRTYLQKY